MAEIIVNGSQKTVSMEHLSPRDIIELAYGTTPRTLPGTVFTITYRGARGAKSDGALTDGDLVWVQNGTVFNAVITASS